MTDLPASTESLCPHCLIRVTARRISEKDAVYLEKNCPVHGPLEKTLLWRNSSRAYTEWARQSCCGDIGDPSYVSIQDCPFACGICSGHKQETCTAIIEITHQCNLNCPVCFADSGTTRHSFPANPDRKQIAHMLQALLDRRGSHPIQFSGGEPTLRDDLPELVTLARNMGFNHIQINTNGIRLAQDPEYVQALKDAGATVVFLQFDGITEDVYLKIRGRELLELKKKAVEQCADLKLGVILVPTLVAGINDDQIGGIIQYAKEWIPFVKGVHFQPMSYLGRYPVKPDNEKRILIPDILDAIEKQTRGELKVENFIPPGCEEPHCSFSALAVLGNNDRLIPTTRFEHAQAAQQCCGAEPAQHSRDYVRSRWKFSDSELTVIDGKQTGSPDSRCGSSPDDFFERIRSHTLCISGMAFQDVWNIDLERLQRCCVHVVTPDTKIIPFCAYYLTGVGGQRLYPLQEEK